MLSPLTAFCRCVDSATAAQYCIFRVSEPSQHPQMEPVTAIAVPLSRTLPLVVRQLDGIEHGRVLEIGCGATPHLAFALAARGHAVVGVDPSLSEEVIQANTDASLSFHKTDFMQFEDKLESFDAVLFTKSLHHVPQLEEALAKAVGFVKPGGFIFIEEFARETIDEPTATWLYGTLDLLEAAGFARKRNHHHGRGHGHGHHHGNGHTHGSHHGSSSQESSGEGHGHSHSHSQQDGRHHHHHSPSGDHQPQQRVPHDSSESKALTAVERFHKQTAHNPPLHTGEAMRAAVKRLSGVRVVEDERVPWLYAFFAVDFLELCPNGLAMLQQILATETQLISLKAIVPLGFNLVLRK